MDQDRDERIRARAHQLWEAEGEPHGRHDEHWRRAAEEINAEGTASADGAADPSSVVAPTTDDPRATHEGRITPAG